MRRADTSPPPRHHTVVMPLAAAEAVAAIVESYLAAGVGFALLFLPRAARRVDPGLGRSAVTVRLVIAPGVVLLWPILARQWWQARSRRAGAGEEAA